MPTSSGPILQRAFKIANDAPAGPVFVALPINVMEQETTVPVAKPAQVFTASRPDPAGIEAMSRLIIAAKNPAIVAGDDVARAGAAKTLEKLVERIGASVWFEGLRGRNSFPTDHPAYRGTLAFDAPGIAKQFAENDLVLLVGGPFFEEVWYGARLAVPGRLQGAADRSRAAAPGLQFRGRCRRDRRRRRRPRGAVAGDHRHQRSSRAGTPGCVPGAEAGR